MPYRYEEQRENLFTDEGQRMFLKIRDSAQRLLAQSGAAMCSKIIAGASGDGWLMMACVDRLVELGELVEVPNSQSRAGQHRLFVPANLNC